MISLKSLPFTSEDFDILDAFQYTFYNNTFTRSFGPFSPGDRISVIGLELDSGILKSHGNTEFSPEEFNIRLREDWEGPTIHLKG